MDHDSPFRLRSLLKDKTLSKSRLKTVIKCIRLSTKVFKIRAECETGSANMSQWYDNLCHKIWLFVSKIFAKNDGSEPFISTEVRLGKVANFLYNTEFFNETILPVKLNVYCTSLLIIILRGEHFFLHPHFLLQTDTIISEERSKLLLQNSPKLTRKRFHNKWNLIIHRHHKWRTLFRKSVVWWWGAVPCLHAGYSLGIAHI